jgi:hypothetical protein
MSQGHGVGRPIGDIKQLPGVFIIDTRGTIVFAMFRPTRPPPPGRRPYSAETAGAEHCVGDELKKAFPAIAGKLL